MSFALTHGNVRVRLAHIRDAKNLEQTLLRHRDWLRPWEATNPEAPLSFEMKPVLRSLLRQYEAGRGIPFIIEVDGQMAGQLNVANILHGSVSSASIGYWVTPDVAGRGVTPTAVALVSDYLFNQIGLHRIEIDIRPENAASLRVVEKLGYRYEGTKLRHIHINGDWRDHYGFALTSEEVREGVLNRWLQSRVPKLEYPWTNA